MGHNGRHRAVAARGNGFNLRGLAVSVAVGRRCGQAISSGEYKALTELSAIGAQGDDGLAMATIGTKAGAVDRAAHQRAGGEYALIGLAGHRQAVGGGGLYRGANNSAALAVNRGGCRAAVGVEHLGDILRGGGRGAAVEVGLHGLDQTIGAGRGHHRASHRATWGIGGYCIDGLTQRVDDDALLLIDILAGGVG